LDRPVSPRQYRDTTSVGDTSRGKEKQERKASHHFNNCSIHQSKGTKNFERNQIKSVLRPPYSPDIEPGDFSLSGMFNQKLEERMILDEQPYQIRHENPLSIDARQSLVPAQINYLLGSFICE
jgi:hypothetical protein